MSCERNESADRQATYKCFDSSNAILVKSAKNAGGRSLCIGPNRAMMSHLVPLSENAKKQK